MIIGVGIDIVSLPRFGKAIARNGMVERLFSVAERAELERFEGDRFLGRAAGRFAAKEALAKALRASDGLVWTDAEVLDSLPVITVKGTVAARAAELGVKSYHVSITHDAGVAAAVVIVES